VQARSWFGKVTGQGLRYMLNASCSVLVPVLLIISCLGNIWQLTVRPTNGDSSLRRTYPDQAVGQVLPPLTVRDPAGNDNVIEYRQVTSPTVLYIFSPSCSWCERNFSRIKQLAQLNKRGFRFIAVSLVSDGLPQYIGAHPLGIPTYSNRSSASILTYGLTSTPQTLVVMPGGKLVKRWNGAYIGKLQAEIEKYFRPFRFDVE
jgi:hypothetical protein